MLELKLSSKFPSSKCSKLTLKWNCLFLKTSQCQCLCEPQYCHLRSPFDWQLWWPLGLSGIPQTPIGLGFFFDMFSITMKRPLLTLNSMPWQLNPSKAVIWIPKVRKLRRPLVYQWCYRMRQRWNSTKFDSQFFGRDQNRQLRLVSHSENKKFQCKMR